MFDINKDSCKLNKNERVPDVMYSRFCTGNPKEISGFYYFFSHRGIRPD